MSHLVALDECAARARPLAGPFSDAVRNAVRAADGLDFGRVRMRLPVTPLLRINLEAGFRIHAAHERRHLWQASRVREAPDFPT